MSNRINKSGKKYISITLIMIIFQAVLLFVAAGNFNINRYWIFIIVNFIYTLIALFFLYKKNPDLINERAKKKDDIKSWDNYLVKFHNLSLILVLPIIAGLDFRFGWSLINMYLIIPGFLIYFISNILVLGSMLANTHFETNVRIQTDRNHKVISSFPYNIVRHPGYLGTILWALAVPAILGSMFAYIPALIAIVTLIIRTYLEDWTLINELPGYESYSKKTKYRIFPLIW